MNAKIKSSLSFCIVIGHFQQHSMILSKLFTHRPHKKIIKLNCNVVVVIDINLPSYFLSLTRIPHAIFIFSYNK